MTTIKPTASAIPPAARVTALPGSRFGSDGQFWVTHQVTVPAGTPLETLLNGAFWRGCAHKLKRADRISWMDDSFTNYGELVVVASDVATGRLEVRELWTLEIPPVTMIESERGGFSIRDLGKTDGFAIYRDADGQQLVKNIPSYDEAARRIKTEYIPALTVDAVQQAGRANR